MRNDLSTMRRHRGFSLIEVLIAVVILSTGLLALAALQGSLTKASADAKVRSQVAALLQGRMDQLRTVGYASATTGSDSCATDLGASDWVPQSFCTQNGLGALSATQTVTTWTGTVGGANFSVGTPGTADDPQFKRIVLSATWTDASGASNRRLALASDLSDLGLKDNLVIPPDESNIGGQAPIVRQASPATAGVIPIAIGGSDATAATNPRPELVGQQNNQQIVATTFNVLTYTNEGSNVARIQRRIENSLVKCRCQYGAGGNNLPEIFRTAQWPAVWNGEAYAVYQPDPAADAPGQALSAGPASGVVQSELCTECCRDHHDTLASPVKFDPERSGGFEKYRRNNTGLVITPSNDTSLTYLNACRIIRVDGFWRTASDTYARQFGLLETQTVSGAQAKTGLPTTTATDAYTTFVTDYLEQYDGTFATGPTFDAETMFNAPARGLNVPATVLIANPSNSDYRYLHGRGLYVDYLEAEARQKLQDVLDDDGAQGRCPTGTPVAECVLPYLPFTTINLTEIAKWVASDTGVLTVNSGNLLATNPAEPSGSRTLGTNVGDADNTGSVRISNSGVAVSSVVALAGGVDPADHANEAIDAQPFQVGGTVSTGDRFDVRVSGGGLNPFVFYTIGLDTGECLKPSGTDHRCSTNTTLSAVSGSVRLENYWIETTTSQSVTASCSLPNGNLVSRTDTVEVPTFRNFVVSAVTRNGAADGTIGAAVNDGKTSESTTISFGAIDANDLIVATLVEQTGSPTYATIASCTTKNNSNDIDNIVWNKPWTQP